MVTRDADVVESNFDQQNRCMDEEADATSKVQATPADNLQCSDTPSVVNTSPRREDGTSGEIVSETKPPPMKAPKGWVRKKGSCSDKHLVTKKPPSVIRLNMQDLTKHVDAAKPTLQQIEGKDVVVLLGNTGTGKSTLMHVLAGRELREQSYKLGNSSVEKTVYEAVEPLEGFAIGHSQKSQTKHLMHYVRPPCPVLDREVVFLDSAGFGDTSGMEVDIATAISLSKVAQACRTLRFVVLISCTSLLESRGGAFRSLVKLMSRLVGTAETEKFDKLGYVFTFLFTHVTVLSSLNMGSDQGDGKDIELKQISCKLHSQLKEIKDGTDTGDPVVQTILMWMDTSLEDEISCVGVFHPKLTSSDWLLEATATFTEVDGYYTALGMEEGQRPQDVMTCVITQEHVHAIKVEVEHLKREFDMYLEHDQVDMLGPVRDAIQFLYSNVDLHCVKNVYFCAAALLNEKIWKSQQELNKFIESSTDDQVTKAGKGDYTIPESSTFEALAKRTFAHDEYVRQLSGLRMKDASLNEDVDEEGGAKVYLCARLHRLGDMLTKEPPIWKLLVWVEKLSAWAQADEHVQADQDMHSTEQANLTDGLAHKLTVHGKHVLNEGVANLMIACNNFIEDAAFQVGDCVEFAVAAGHIQGLLIHRDRIEMLGVCLMKLDSTWLRMEQHLEDILAFHVESAQKVLLDLSINASSNNSEAEQPGDLGAHVACLDAFVIFLIDAGAPSKFISKSTDSLQTILAEARNCVEEHAAIVDATSLRDSRSGPIVNNHVMLMKLLVLVLDKIRCEERVRCDHSKKLYDSTLKRLESSLRKQKTQLECLCDQMHREVLASTEFHSQLLSTLIAYTWLDDYLSPESQFVANKVEKHREEYLSHQETLHCQCLVSLNEYLQSPTEQCAAFSMLQERFSEAQQLVLICRSHFPAILNKEKHLSEVMDRTVKNWCLEQDKLVEYPNTLDTLSSFSSAVANSMLKACEDLRTVKPAESRIAELYNKLVAWLKKTADNIGSLVEAKGHFTSKQIVLDTLFHWQEQGLSHLTAQLPLLTDLQVSIGKSIAAQVKHLRELISESPNDDNIDAALKDLKDACCLDHHINQRASTELDSLTQLIEAKRAGLDKQLTDNIQNFEFDDVDGHLLKLSKSKDAQNKLRFKNLMMVVEMAVKSKISLANQHTAHGREASEIYLMLEKADKSVGKILSAHKSISICDAMNDIKEGVCKHAAALTNQLQSAHADLDHPQILQLTRELREYIHCTDRLLDDKLKNTANFFIKKDDKFRRRFRKMVDRFLTSFGEEKHDTTDLHVCLKKWKKALASLDREDISEYNDLMRQIGNTLNNKHALLMNSAEVKVPCSLSVCAYTLMNDEWEKGLKDHVTELNFNIQDMLKKCKQSEHEADALSEQNFLDIPSKYWVSELDSLNDSTLWKFLKRDAYEHRKNILIKLIFMLVDNVRQCLGSRDYARCGDIMNALVHRRKELRHHIDGCSKVDQSLSDTMKCLSGHRQEIEMDLTGLLDCNSILEFAALFREYVKFVKHLDLREGDNKKCCLNSQLHKKICSSVENCLREFQRHLQAFEFEQVFETVQILRALGVVLAGDFASYTEKCKELVRGKHDEWLKRLHEIQNKEFGGTHLKEIAKHFSVLELDHNATQKDVESAFRRLSLKSHPDKAGGSDEKMRLLQEAKTVLYNNSKSYQDVISQLFSNDIRKALENLETNAATFLKDARYKCVSDMLQNLESYHLMTELVPKLRSKQEIQRKVHELVRGHVKTIQDSINNHWDTRQFKQLHDDFTRLASIDSHLSSFSSMNVSGWVKTIRKDVEEDIDKLASKAVAHLTSEKTAFANIKDFALQLILLGRILDDLPRFKSMASEKIHNLLQTCQEKPSWGGQFLFKLGMELQRGTVGTLGSEGKLTPEDQQRVGRVLVREFKQFSDVLTSIWNETVAKQNVEYTVNDIVSKSITCDSCSDDAPMDTDLLLRGFRQYQKQYDAWFNQWYAGDAKLEDIAQKCMADAADLGLCRTNMWTWELREKIPCLLGGVFAYFTIFKSGESYKILESSSQRSNGVITDTRSCSTNGDTTSAISTDQMLIKPHSIQVLSILRMLGYDMPREEEDLVNHLMQIRTGEGKSMILGACSVILGLLGFNVRCICYSKYLSNRDFVLFEEIFSAFGVKSCIVYSTIEDYCDDTFCAKGDIIEMTRNLLLRNGEEGSSQASSGCLVPHSDCSLDNTNILPSQEILLVDEVDVFYGKKFYGKTLNYMTRLRIPEVRTMLQSIWEKRPKDKKSEFASWEEHRQTVVKSTSYIDLCRRYPAWKKLLEHEVGKMCRDVSLFADHEYDFDRAINRVGYKRMDCMDYHICKGYLTAFAYLNEAAKGNLRNPEKTLDDQLGLQVSCGYHLYSDIKPACILGISGTVEALGKYEWGVMNKYKIQVYTRMPSVYGMNNFHFLDQAGNKQLILESTKDAYFREITDAANHVVKGDRSVIVFFDDNPTLQDYASSAYYAKLVNKAILDETMSHEEKDYIVKKAATSGQVTLTTAIFGRGTDFRCYDEEVSKRGGVHVIQAFLSESKMEEVQIQGRTARQGAKGTYSMVLYEEHLKKLAPDITAESATRLTKKQLYDRLDECRQSCHEKACKYVDESLESNKKFHELTHKYFDALISGDRESAFQAGRSLWCK